MSAIVLRRIIVGLALALAAWAGLALLSRGRVDQPTGLMLPALSPAEVDRVTLGRAADTVVLTRSGSAWTVNGFPASGSVVGAFLQAAGDSTAQSELIAQSANPHQRLGVDSAQARRLTVVKAGQPVVDLYVGNRGPEFEGFYVRRTRENAVYLLRGQFAEALARGVDEWRAADILAVSADRIGGVAVRRGRESYTLTRGPAGWAVARAPADSAKVARFLAQFGGVRASGFPDPLQAESITFAPAEREVALLGPDGGPLESLTLDSAEMGFWARNAAGVIYRIDRATADRLTPPLNALK